METLQPKLRFPMFEGDWERKSLRDITSLVTKGTTPKFFTESGINFIKIECLNGHNIDTSKCLFIDETTHNKELKRSILKEDDLLFAIAGATIGKCTIVDKSILPANTNQALSIIRLNNNENKNYIFQILTSEAMKKYIIDNISVGAQPNLNLEQINSFSFSYPTLHEQTRIANFLSSVDEKLNLLKEKKALLEDYKKGIMQKIFNQEIRFKDDNGNDFEEWKESILSEVVNLFHGYQFRTSDFTSKGIAVIKISNVIGNNLDLTNLTFIKKERFDDFKSFEIKNDDILMSLTGNIGRIIEVKDKPFSLLQNYRVGKFIPLDENVINKPFLKYLLASDLVFGRFSQLANQSAQANFGKQDMDKINISYPTIEEQTKIANFLSAIDEKIELVSNQIQDTQEYKKGLLQQMFV